MNRVLRSLGTALLLLNLTIIPSYSFSSTAVVNPLPGTGGVTCDGDVGTNFNVSFEAAYSVADCVDCSTPGIITAETSVGVSPWDPTPLYSVIRAVVNFDTSFLGQGAQVLSATVSVKSTNVHFSFNSQDDFVRLVSSSFASPSAYAVTDFDSFGTAALAPDVQFASIVTEQYVDFQLNAAGLASLNKAGVSSFGLRTGLDVNDQAPVMDPELNRGGSLVFFHSADTPGTDSDPKLTITYLPGGQQLTASIVASPTGGTAPLTVNFSVNANQPVTSVIWKLNGVQFSQAPTPQLVFTQAGNYRLDAVVFSGNASVTVTTFVTVTSCVC